MTNLIYLIGPPGAGKSTAMHNATATLTRLPLPKDQHPARDTLLHHGELAAVELGQHRDTFPGTDTLPMSIINRAIPYLADPPEQPPLILAEGARLANKRFLTAAAEHCQHVHLIYLDNPHADTWRATRAQQLGKTQNESWAKGRATAARNLATNPPAGVDTTTVHHPDEAADLLRQHLPHT